MAGAGDVVLTRTLPRDARLAFVRESGATYTVVNRASGEVLAEVMSSPNEDLYLAVPAGEYRFLRRTMGEVRERTLALSSGSVTSLDPNTMTKVAQASARSKSGFIELHNQLGAYAGVATSAVPGGPGFVGAFALSYARDFGSVALRGRASFSAFDNSQDIYHSSLLRAALGLDLLLPVLVAERFSIHLGPTVGMPMVRQRDMRGEVGNSFGFSYGAAATVVARAYGRTFVSLNVDGGGELFRLDGQVVHRPAASALLGATLAF
jgi:hypothetical protein